MSTMLLLHRARKGRSAGNVYPSERSPSFERALPPERRALCDRWTKTLRYRPLWRVFYEYVATAPIAEIEADLVVREAELARHKRALALASARERRQQKKFEGAVVLDTDVVARSKQDVSGKYVWLYHGTSSRMLPRIKRSGLCPSSDRRTFADTTPGYVYLTVDIGDSFRKDGAPFYARHAAAVLGGTPVILRVRVPWDDLEPDLDDEDIPSGRDQYRYAACIPPQDIAEVVKLP